MQVSLNDSKRKLIEELGVLYERSAMQPAAARVLALLTIADEVELSFEDIYETLNISKSAASNAINLLLNTNRVEYITKPGERKRYFRMKLNGLKDNVQQSLLGLSSYSEILKRILGQRPKSTKDFNANLADVISFLDFLQKELPLTIAKWEKQKQ